MIAIIDYKAGNTKSLSSALDRLGESSVITSNANEITKADKVILPGVGQAATAIQNLKNSGLINILANLSQPVLGICLGMQLLASQNEEGNIEGIGIFEEHVKRFPAEGVVPHMGWNNLEKLQGPLFSGITTDDNVYYAHSYYVENGRNSVGITNYILPFSASLQKNNFFGVQFHPEKSADTGNKILLNFLSL